MEAIAKQAHQQLLKAQNILAVSHPNPDGDTLGSACALLQYLKRRGQKASAWCATPIKKQLCFLPHTENFVFDWQKLAHPFDTIVVLDAGDLRYAGIAKYLDSLNPKPVIINIDHHATNEFYGNYNLVNKEAAATAEVMHHFFKINDISLDATMSLALLTGLVTDTSLWSNPATTATALLAGSELLANGGNLRLIQNWLFENKSLAALQLWGLSFSRLAPLEKSLAEDLRLPRGEIIRSYLTLADRQKLALEEEELEGLINFLSGTLDAPAILLLSERDNGIIKGSFRTRRDEVDVSLWAKALGGGGHKKAAGFAINGRLDKTPAGLQIKNYV